jgi:endonuclease III related protein
VLRAWRTIPGPPRDVVKARLLRLYRTLLRRYGPQGWWPGRTPFEIAVGAILTQHTNWSNAALAVASLGRRRLLGARAVDRASETELAEVIRSAGTYRLKARRLKAFTRWLLDRFGGRFGAMRAAPLDVLRRELLAVPGLGPETVDAILLYAAGRPVFVADAYARRVLARHRLLPAKAGYDEARAFLEAHLPSDPALFNEFHALLVAVGKRHCRAVPRCVPCPLRADLDDRPPASLTRTPPRSRPRAVLRHRGRPAPGRARPSPSAGSRPRAARAPARRAPAG